MARRTQTDDDDDEGYDDDDAYDAEEDSHDDEDATIPCPHCGREVYDDAERCPYCDRYLSREDAPRAPKPWWLILGVAAGLYAVYRSLLYCFG